RNIVVDDAIRSGQESVVVDWLSGACMLAKRAALTAVRGFDERFFLYWEDADLCRRLRNRGYHVRYVPGATAIHRVGQSSRAACSPMDRVPVSPGDSMPAACTRRGHLSSLVMRKSE